MDLFAAGSARLTDKLERLNAEQREAVMTTTGPLLILAGAGSGKTRVITERIAYLIDTCGVRPDSLLAVTFTNKAAGEMKERVDRLLADYYGSERAVAAPLISTFHSLCVRILRRNIDKLERGYTRSFTIYDTDDQQRLLRAVIKDIGLDEKQLPARLARSAISAAKNRGEDAEMYARGVNRKDDFREPIAHAFSLYEQRLAASNALDFDDLLIRTLQLLRHSEAVRSWYHNRFRHVMVDEFQDTNGIQYSLTRLIVEGDRALNLAGADEHWKDRSFAVVGDESQSIYGWRGSDFNIILGFTKDFPGTKVIKLEENYRSTKRILEAANGVIANNQQRFDKVLRTKADEGERVGYAQLIDADEEARWIVRRIEEHHARDPEVRVAVLYRTNAQSRHFEEACRRSGLSYNLVGGFSFYERAEVKDVIGYLRLAINPDDSMALVRVINTPARGIGKSTLEEITRLANESGMTHWEALGQIIDERLVPPRAVSALKSFQGIITGLMAMAQSARSEIAEVVKSAVIDSGYERSLEEENNEEAEGRLFNLQELVNAAAESQEQGETLRDFLDHAALVADTDAYSGAARVTLMTMHSAKGLEFPIVFIAGMEEGLFPGSRVSEGEDRLEEERRLCYVAITRAEKKLYVTHALRRRVYGIMDVAEPSRFLNELPKELIENLSTGPSWLGYAGVSPAALRQMQAPVRESRTSNYTGRTYNDIDSVKQYLAKREKQTGATGSSSGFKPGTRVRHREYGPGLVLKCEGEGDSLKVTVRFPVYGTKKLLAKFAALEIIGR